MEEYAAVFARHQDRLLRIATLVAGDADLAADAVAEAFARTYPHWRRGRVDDVGAYLRRAVLNEIHRSWRRRRPALPGAARADGPAADDGLGERDRVLRALDDLPERQRTAVVLRFYGDYGEAAIADAMGVPVGTVKSTLSRALGKLRAALGEEIDHA